MNNLYHFENTDVFVNLDRVTAVEFQHYADGGIYAVKLYFVAEKSSYNIPDREDAIWFKEYLVLKSWLAISSFLRKSRNWVLTN